MQSAPHATLVRPATPAARPPSPPVLLGPAAAALLLFTRRCCCHPAVDRTCKLCIVTTRLVVPINAIYINMPGSESQASCQTRLAAWLPSRLPACSFLLPAHTRAPAPCPPTDWLGACLVLPSSPTWSVLACSCSQTLLVAAPLQCLTLSKVKAEGLNLTGVAVTLPAGCREITPGEGREAGRQAGAPGGSGLLPTWCTQRCVACI